MDGFDIYADLDAQAKDGLNDSSEALEEEKWTVGWEHAMTVTQDLLLIQRDILGSDYAAQPAHTADVQSNEAVTEQISAVGDAAAVDAVQAVDTDPDVAAKNNLNDSGSDTSDFEFSSDSELEESEQESKPNPKRKAVNLDEDDLDEDGPAPVGPLKTKNEMDLPPIEKLDIVIPETADLKEIGEVFALVNNTLVIQSTPIESITLDADSILCTADRKVFGKVFETFGPVKEPMYSVLYSPDVNDVKVEVGDKVFYVSEMAKFVFAAQLKAMKGSDASNFYDEEVADHEREFSDDEQEQEFRAQRKLERKRNAKHNDADDEEDGQVVDDAESFLNQRRNNGPSRNDRITRGSDRGNRVGRGAGGGRGRGDAFSRGGGGRGGFHDSGPRQYAHELPSRGNRGGFENRGQNIRRNSSDRNHETPPNQNGYENYRRPISAPSNSFQKQAPSAPMHHSLPPKPQSAATQLPQRPAEAPIPGLPAMITQQQMLALMQQQQIQLQRQHQQQLQLATAAMARGLPVHPGMMMQSPLYGGDGAPSHAMADPMGNTANHFPTSATGTMNNLGDAQMGEQ
ncbi:Gar1/Naf1 RNA binding region-domain-containing protein [Chytriomyces cf. hyalinus JEL632]|nr:Gar1/Naf1 RNA binding region-domain-containing protein [Chytriomyces cf. hyalinus JEL632]